MMKLLMKLHFAMLLSAGSLFAQTITGSVQDASTGELLVGVNILVTGTTTGTSSKEDGSFSVNVNRLPAALRFSYVGYETQEVSVSSTRPIIVRLTPAGVDLEDLVVIGSRFLPRSVIDAPVPIDNISAKDLGLTPQVQFDKMLHYKVPSFNSTQQTISDATAHFDVADLRGLGPSRTLVLVNGKRKNASAMLYINDTPGKGEVGVDMKSIPAAAIERVEVLRDGASAQYGSDAIAGVINIILKDDYEYTDVNFFSGITSEGDGMTKGFSVNTGAQIGNGGFINFTTSVYDQEETNRAGTPGADNLFGVAANDATWGSWLAANPDLGMHVGQPNLTSTDVFYNFKQPTASGASLYSFGGVVYRRGQSYALYRTPYWKQDPYFLLHDQGTTYNGYQPTFETDIFDYSFALGLKGAKSGWNYDVSSTSGRNTVKYTIGNTLNDAMGPNSPTTFDAGAYKFSNIINNLDVSRQIGKVSLGLGSEFRIENFQATAGEDASYLGNGANSFPGLQPQNEANATRYNVGVYADLTADITPNFLVGGAARYENYNDFGDNFSWKVNARYKAAEGKIVARASASTGFRAPSLHQIHMSNIQTLVSGGTVSNQGTFDNLSPVVRSLGVARLKEEDAINYTAGLALRPTPNFSFTADYYNISVNDRILFSSSIAGDGNPATTTPVEVVLTRSQITSLKFFINAVDTRTSGVDLVANYDGLKVAGGDFGVSLSANFNKNEINGAIRTPAAISNSGGNIFDRKEQSRILTARPNDKVILGLNFEKKDLSLTLNNTRFGTVTWQHADDPNKDQTFSAKIVTDLLAGYRFSNAVKATLSVNNLLNVYPDVIDNKGDVVTDLGGRFKYPWEVNQFGFNGMTVLGGLNIRF